MTQKKKRQFGVWMDAHHAIIVGRADAGSPYFSVLGLAGNTGVVDTTQQKKQYPDERTLQDRYFKEILFYMRNADEVYLTGTGDSQEQLVHFMADSPQFKGITTRVSTSKKMEDEDLAEYISGKFS